MSKAKSDSIKNSQSVPNIKNISPVSFWKLVYIPSVNLNLTEIDISFFLLWTETVFCSSCYCLLLIALLQSSNSWKELHIHIVFCIYNISLGTCQLQGDLLSERLKGYCLGFITVGKCYSWNIFYIQNVLQLSFNISF